MEGVKWEINSFHVHIRSLFKSLEATEVAQSSKFLRGNWQLQDLKPVDSSSKIEIEAMTQALAFSWHRQILPHVHTSLLTRHPGHPLAAAIPIPLTPVADRVKPVLQKFISIWDVNLRLYRNKMIWWFCNSHWTWCNL